MITLFVKTGCPFCARARAALDAHELEYVEKNVSDPEVVRELIELGGKKQEPFLVDGDIMMYESKSIIEYVEKKYGKHDPDRKRAIHFVGGGVCPTGR